MPIYSDQQITEFKKKLEEKGEKAVRLEIANNIYSKDGHLKVVENWLAEKDKESQEQKLQNELDKHEQMYQEKMKKDEARFQTQLEVSKSQSDNARISAMASFISALVSILGAIIAIASLLHH